MQNFLEEKQFIASALITTKTTPKKILLVHHKKTNTWLQPGGHIEHTENPLEAVMREVKEETGLNINEYILYGEKTDESVNLPIPRFILEEKIPEYENHPFHYHIDLQYHIQLDKEVPVTMLEKEVYAIGWFTKEEALQLPLFENTRKIIEELLS